MKNDSENPRPPWGGTFFSVKYLLVRALAIGVMFAFVHLAGLREYTTFITGTTGSSEISWRLSAFYGTLYLALYMGCIVVAPILILTALLLVVWEKGTKNKGDKLKLELQTRTRDTTIIS